MKKYTYAYNSLTKQCSPSCSSASWSTVFVTIGILTVLLVATVYVNTRSKPYESLSTSKWHSQLPSGENLTRVLFKNERFENPWINSTESSSIVCKAVKSFFEKDNKRIPTNEDEVQKAL